MFSQDLADTICQQLAEGKSLRTAAADAGVSHSTVLRWTEDSPEFADQYARARKTGYSLLAEDIMEISDDDLDDNPVSVARAKLRVDSRKWILSKMLPKVYGDKLDLDVKGSMSVKLDTGDGGVL